MEGHIIIFKKEVGEVIVDAPTCELDNGFLLCPKASEGNLGIRGLGYLCKLAVIEDMTGKRFTITTDTLDVNANGRSGKGYSNGLLAMTEIKVES